MRFDAAPSNAGEVLDQAIVLTRSHFGLLLKVMLPPLLLVGLALGFAISQGDQQENPWMALPLLLFMLVGPLYWLAAIHTAGECYVGRPVGVNSAYRHAFRVWLPAFWTAILFTLCTWAVNMIFVFPLVVAGGAAMLGLGSIGIVVFVVSYIAMLAVQWTLNLYFVLAISLVVLEKINGIKAIMRSFRLMKGNLGSAMLLGVVVPVLSYGALGVQFLLPFVQLRVIGLLVVAGLVSNFVAVAAAVFYFACRAKVEHYHLFLLADAVGINENQAAGQPQSLIMAPVD